MSRKPVSGIMLTLFLIAMLMLTLTYVIAELDEPKNIPLSGATDAIVTKVADWWPMFRHDPNHTGYSTSKAPNTNNTIWSYTTGREVFSSPIAVDGRVYVGSYDSHIYCINASTGSKIWNYPTNGLVSSSPAVADGKVVVGSHDNNVYCLNASMGTLIWNYPANDIVVSSPAVDDGKIYVGSADKKVYCLNASTGTLIWNCTTDLDVASSPAVANGKVYVGCYDFKVYCIDASTGEHVWNHTTGEKVFSSPAVADGRVYVGSRDKNVYCLDASTGAHIWNYTTGDCVESSPAVADGKVYAGSWDKKVYCLNASTGAYVWSYPTLDRVESSPAVADGKIFVGSNDFKVYCLDTLTGAHIWNYTTDMKVVSSPAVADGKIYIGSYDDTIYAFGIHDVAVTDVTPSKTIVGQGYFLSVNITVENQGTISETFNVTAYYNSNVINNTKVTGLSASEKATFIFAWNTTGVALGNYTINAIADTIPGEIDPTDNTFTDGIVLVTFPGDVNGDGKVRIDDILAIAIAFGSDLGDPDYDPNLDVNGDNKIRVDDILIAVSHFGETLQTPVPQRLWTTNNSGLGEIDEFLIGSSVYLKTADDFVGTPLIPGKYRVWLFEGNIIPVNGLLVPSDFGTPWGLTPMEVYINSEGRFGPVKIWDIPMDPMLICHNFTVVLDQLEVGLGGEATVAPNIGVWGDEDYRDDLDTGPPTLPSFHIMSTG